MLKNIIHYPNGSYQRDGRETVFHTIYVKTFVGSALSGWNCHETVEYFKSQEYTGAAQHALSCINHHTNLVLRAGQAWTGMVKYFKTTSIVWNSDASFGLTPFCADCIDYMECDTDVKTFQAQ